LPEKLGSLPENHIEVFNKAKEGKISFEEGERLLVKMYRETGKATEEHIRKVSSQIKIKEDAEDLINYLKEKGYIIYLISGAVDIYVEEIAKRLNVDGFYANSHLEFNQKGILEKINYRSNQRRVKLKQLEELVNELEISMDEVVFVGDSDNDMEVFQETNHGISINSSSEELSKVAWKNVNSFDEIKKIL